MKHVQTIHICAFCRAGILVRVESDRIRRDGQGTPTCFTVWQDPPE